MPTSRRVPIEIDLLILSFLGHFAWELLQAPLYSSFEGSDHLTGIWICLRATIGDLAIALAAFWAASLFGGGRMWAARLNGTNILLFFGTGLVATVGWELLSTNLLDRWSYGPLMPRLPLIGVGLSPLLQWVAIPGVVLWYLRRLIDADDVVSLPDR